MCTGKLYLFHVDAKLNMLYLAVDVKLCTAKKSYY